MQKAVSSSHSPPLGIGYVGTYLRDYGNCDVEIVDPMPQGLSESDILAKSEKAHYVGLSCYTDIRFQCFELAEKIKARNPQCTLIVGGPHTYHLDEAIIGHYPFIDIVVRGEGEETALEIISGTALPEIRGITYRQGGAIKRNDNRDFFEDIDHLYVDYSLMPDMSLYRGDVEAPADIKALKTVYMIESRGCAFKCSYCANDHWNRTWRATSAHKIVDKMERLVKEYGIEYFRFYDDLFTLDKKRVFVFCDEIKKRNLDVKFRVLVRAGTDRQVLERLKDAGCESVGFGIETGSDRMLKRINKGITRAQILETLQACRETGLWSIGSFIISLPDETYDDFKESLSLMKYPDSVMVGVLMLFPYTPFYRELLEKGEIKDDIWFDRSFPNKIFYTEDLFPGASFSLKDLKRLNLYALYHTYINNPEALFRKHGFAGGLLRYIKAFIDIPLHGRLDALYNRFFVR